MIKFNIIMWIIGPKQNNSKVFCLNYLFRNNCVKKWNELDIKFQKLKLKKTNQYNLSIL